MKRTGQGSPVAVLTPSFYGDFERCRMLSDSLARFMVDDYRHTIVVDRADLPLFRPLQGPHTDVLAKEDVLPSWITDWRIPLPRKNRYMRVSLKSWPLRGWAVQQFAKLCVSAQLTNDYVIMVDSDVCLFRPFRIADVMRGGLAPLYAKPGVVTADMQEHVRWQHTAERVLGVPAAGLPGKTYISPFNIWRPEIVRALRAHMEERWSRDWIVTAARNWRFCEPVVYGRFVEDQGPEACGQYMTPETLCYSYWEHRPVDDAALRAYLTRCPDHCYAVNIQSKSGIPLSAYRHLVYDTAV